MDTTEEKFQRVIWAADELGVAVQKWTDYREKYESGDCAQEKRAKEALEKYWRVTGGAPALRGLGQ